ncbi:MAG TPA: hypothetical protein VF373_06150 [Prolixibacteraceae bacterium]
MTPDMFRELTKYKWLKDLNTSMSLASGSIFAKDVFPLRLTPESQIKEWFSHALNNFSIQNFRYIINHTLQIYPPNVKYIFNYFNYLTISFIQTKQYF